jgi:hypothetical protein
MKKYFLIVSMVVITILMIGLVAWWSTKLVLQPFSPIPISQLLLGGVYVIGSAWVVSKLGEALNMMSNKKERRRKTLNCG